MSASNFSLNRASLQIDQVDCRSTEADLKELKACSNGDEREVLAQNIISKAINRSLDEHCEVQVRKAGHRYVLSVVHPHSHLSEILPSEASDWINAARNNREVEPLAFSIVLPESILARNRVESAGCGGQKNQLGRECNGLRREKNWPGS